MASRRLTKDGTRIAVMINVATPDDLLGIKPGSCDGIGLVRTEFLVADGAVRDEHRQLELYSALIAWAEGRPVTIRTLDAGGDKPIPGYTIDGERNPFLGLRGIRLSLRHRDVFRIQLRALARAAALGAVKVMLPMVTTAEELAEMRALLAEVVAELAREGARAARPELGIMVEVPLAAVAIDQFDAAFFFIGSNDLVQFRSGEHLVRRGRGEDLPRTRGIQHPEADEAGVQGFMTRAVARDQRHLAGLQFPALPTYPWPPPLSRARRRRHIGTNGRIGSIRSCTGPYAIKDGQFHIPNLPGIGLEWNEDAVAAGSGTSKRLPAVTAPAHRD